MESVIKRASLEEQKVVRAKIPDHFRDENETAAAYQQVGDSPNRNTRSWYRDIYDFYQNNEC